MRALEGHVIQLYMISGDQYVCANILNMYMQLWQNGIMEYVG